MGGGRPFLGGGLGVDPGMRLLSGQAVAGDQPLQLQFGVDVHHHDRVEGRLLTRLDQQRDHLHHDRSRRGGFGQLDRPRPDGGVHDRLQVAPGRRIGEHDRPQRGPVEGSVGGAGPYYFLVDTGSSVTLVSDRIAATVPGFRPNVGLAPVQVISAAGGATLLGSITVPSIELGGTGFATVRAAVYDFVDFSNHLGVTVDGILGFPVFRDVLLTLDYPRSRVVLSPRFPARAIPGIAVPFALEDGTRPIINVELGAATFMALIDSGSNLPFTLNATGLNPSFKYGPRTGPLVATRGGSGR